MEGKMETTFFVRNTSEKSMHFPKRTLTLGVKAGGLSEVWGQTGPLPTEGFVWGKDAEEALTAPLRVRTHPLSGVG